ncbi:hypothetical protein MM440_13725 [Arsenicicoccus piscis]|uniref:Uncharacterized protein n=1 Tax=Arsenicicoccus piscis TaxID=673954 RepID=A0ABQ6HQ91_9MICO|nr:hypothetical protein [Arsenicicoccus piscis]MCH8628790.1 hypothetical protein [Arsenicicoccus piscis]GMA20162.1 hypothetical protein GCM10025862_21830 [Arsenicicoccus piscis]
MLRPAVGHEQYFSPGTTTLYALAAVAVAMTHLVKTSSRLGLVTVARFTRPQASELAAAADAEALDDEAVDGEAVDGEAIEGESAARSTAARSTAAPS